MTPMPTRQTRHALGFLVLALGPVVLGEGAAACVDRRAAVESAPRTPPDVTNRNATCEGCHAEIASEWRASLHRASYSDPMYQRAFAREPLAFCTGCHAPEANAEDPGPSPTHALGVGCVTCHALSSEHPRLATATATATATDDTCARCHEFQFPGTRELMQLTVTEHRASPAASSSCASCHMPKVEAVEPGGRRHASHRFGASRDVAMIRSAARITVAREGSKLRFSFAPDRTGHAFPTGDIFRRLRLVADLEGIGGPRHVQSFLGRKTKRADVLAGGEVNVADDRPFVRGAPAVAELEVGIPSGRVTWRVLYERVEHPSSLDERDAVIEGAIEVASGTLD